MRRGRNLGDHGPALVVLALSALGVTLLAAGAASGTADAPEAPSSPPVIGFFDTGINPYHEEFRAPAWTDHPSTYIEGYPEHAEPIDLTLEADTFEEAWQADRDEWASLEPGQLYYVPGTRIVGVIDGHVEFREAPAPGYDHDGHGTMVASAAAGATLGTAPDAAIVMASGQWDGTAWFTEQPWVDLLSYSIGPQGGVHPPGKGAVTHEIANQGRSFFAAGGNGPTSNGPTTLTSGYTGPPWTVTVGLHRQVEDSVPTSRFCTACHLPTEVLGTTGVAVAATDSLDGTTTGTGTSTATPRVAGHALSLVDLARDRLDDVTRPGLGASHAYATASPEVELPAQGPLADGVFDRSELEDLVRQAARPAPWSTPNWEALGLGGVLPDDLAQPGEARYTWQGYGVHNATANAHAERVLLGHTTPLDRPADDRWHAFWTDARGAYWSTLLCAWSEDYSARYEGDCRTDPTVDLAETTAQTLLAAATADR